MIPYAVNDGLEKWAENSCVSWPEVLSLQVLSTSLHFILNKLLRKTFPWLNSSGKQSWFEFRHSLWSLFHPGSWQHLEVPGLNLLVCFCYSVILPFAWKNSSGPPCSAEHKWQIFLQAGSRHQKANPAGAALFLPVLASSSACSVCFFGKERCRKWPSTGGDKLVVASLSSGILLILTQEASSDCLNHRIN